MKVEAYRHTLVEHALPFWADRGFDRGRARFRERLDLTGKPLPVPHRSMVQARQIYVFAHAAKLGWFLEGAGLARTAMDSLLAVYGERDGERMSFHFSADDDGLPVSRERDAYAHAFMLFALASLLLLERDEALLNVVDNTIAFIDQRLTDPIHGGLFDALPLSGGTKQQNPLMHLLEAYLFLEVAAPGRGYLERAAGLVALFKHRLFKPEPGVLLEYFEADWTPHADATKAGLFEPGHHFEWTWLLERFGEMSGTDQTAWIEPLYRVARDHGIGPDRLIFDEVDISLRPIRQSHRLWPHAEAIKAAVARDAGGDALAAGFAEEMAGRLLETFLDRPFSGGWIDHIAEDGTPLVDYVPASSLYHLFLAAAETQRLAARSNPALAIAVHSGT